jgi:putative membrane protein
MVGYAQAQQQVVQEQAKPAQYADQDTGQPLRDRIRGSDRRDAGGNRSTTYFRGPDTATATAGSANSEVDHYLASCLSIKNQAEIEINEFALEKSENAQVKQFAQQMIDDHRQLAERLAQLTGVNQGQTANNQAALDQLLQIDRQIVDQCTSMAREKLSQKSGAEFDQCFIGAQVGAHMGMLSALTVIADRTGGQLQQVASDAKTTVEQHLQQAEQLAKQLATANRG